MQRYVKVQFTAYVVNLNFTFPTMWLATMAFSQIKEGDRITPEKKRSK